MNNTEIASKFISETIKPSLKEAALARANAWIEEASDTGYYRCPVSMSRDGREYVQDARSSASPAHALRWTDEP